MNQINIGDLLLARLGTLGHQEVYDNVAQGSLQEGAHDVAVERATVAQSTA